VDYERRRKLLADLRGLTGPKVAFQIMERADEGMPKMWVVHQALLMRCEHPELFGADVAYAPLVVAGSRSEHAVAYLRGDSVATVIPRWNTKLGGAWRDTNVELPQGKWANRLTGAVLDGGRVALKTLLREFPVALLIRESSHA